jgi:hypothetical protein
LSDGDRTRGTCNGVPTLLIEKFSRSETLDSVGTHAPDAESDTASDVATDTTPTPPSDSDGDTAVDAHADTAFSVDAQSDSETVAVTLGGETHHLSRRAATALRDGLADALTGRREFLRTTGEHRSDGSYVVARRRAESAGHSKVFESFAALEALFAELPTEFTAEAVGRSGVTGGRRHILLRHFVEHPAFDCDLVSRQPLTARKGCEDGSGET